MTEMIAVATVDYNHFQNVNSCGQSCATLQTKLAIWFKIQIAYF